MLTRLRHIALRLSLRAPRAPSRGEAARRQASPGLALLLVVLAAAASTSLDAQRGRGAATPQTPREAAAIDLTGTWTAVISEDWALRMLTPRKGDYVRMPLTPAARKIADAWDPALDEAAGEQCKGYGAPAIMRLPGRIRISWQGDSAMKMELEAGSQTRLFHFGSPPAASEASWQGQSAAEWQYTRVPPRTGEMKVSTTRLRPGYLRKNGVPYSANTTMTEYYHLMTAPNGDVWITVVTEVKDPENLTDPFVQSTHFKKLPATATFKPEPCEAR